MPMAPTGSAQEEMLGVSERTRHLEDAVANLSERSLSRHDAMLPTRPRRRCAWRKSASQQLPVTPAAPCPPRDLYADQTLATINDSAPAAVRQNLTAEREALAAVAPVASAN